MPAECGPRPSAPPRSGHRPAATTPGPAAHCGLRSGEERGWEELLGVFNSSGHSEVERRVARERREARSEGRPELLHNYLSGTALAPIWYKCNANTMLQVHEYNANATRSTAEVPMQY